MAGHAYRIRLAILVAMRWQNLLVLRIFCESILLDIFLKTTFQLVMEVLSCRLAIEDPKKVFFEILSM